MLVVFMSFIAGSGLLQEFDKVLLVSLISAVALLTHLHALANNGYPKSKIRQIQAKLDVNAGYRLALLSSEQRHYDARRWSHQGANWCTFKTQSHKLFSEKRLCWRNFTRWNHERVP